MPDILKVAREFSATLQCHLQETGKGTIDDVVARNAAETWPGVCHSHDFCDANRAMAEAFATVTGNQPDPASEDDAAMWSSAWDIAAAAKFFTQTERT